MSNENNDKALDLIEKRNKLESYLFHCIRKQYEYEDHRDISYWQEREVDVRKGIEAIERELNLLK